MKRTKVKCLICGQEISKSNYSKHMRRHRDHPESFEVPRYRILHAGLTCQYCGKECKNSNSLMNHERLCKKNPGRQKTPTEKRDAPIVRNGEIKKSSGLKNADELHNIQCPYCNLWFKNTQIGGHIGWCSKKAGKGRYVIKDHKSIGITVSELEEYKQRVTKCEICGKEETCVNASTNKVQPLCIDHDHNTNQFRGLLCVACNRALGWYENNKEKINEYLTRSSQN